MCQRKLFANDLNVAMRCERTLFYSDLFNEPVHKTDLNESVRAPLVSTTQRPTEPRTVIDFEIE